MTVWLTAVTVWLTAVTVWLFSREGVAKSPCKCGSGGGIYNEFAILFDDPDHSIEEERFLIIGSIKSEKICIVSHCYRDHENRIRIISARQATKTEQRAYLDGI